MLKYAKITEHDVANGQGVGVVIWLQGCSHRCAGCHNQSTWDWNDGLDFDEDARLKLLFAISKPYISRITFSGGDPLYRKNRKEVVQLIDEIKQVRPDIKIWLYTGYTYWQVRKMSVDLSNIDVLIDGPFIQELKDISLLFRGSRNQRLIDWKKTLSLSDPSEVILYPPCSKVQPHI